MIFNLHTLTKNKDSVKEKSMNTEDLELKKILQISPNKDMLVYHQTEHLLMETLPSQIDFWIIKILLLNLY